MDKNLHLDSVIKTHQISKEEVLLEKYRNKNKEVKEALEKKYGSKMYSPFNSGSYAKNTAINTRFDFDQVAPFRKSAFDTLKKMYEDVYDFLYEKYMNVAEVKKQKVSIGLEFYADADGDVIKIDVVPGRELKQDEYDNDRDLNLYVYDKYGSIDAGSERIKTNVVAQINNIKERATSEKDSIRKIIRLMKVWKTTKYNYPTKSFFLELVIIKAFDSKPITGSLWDKLRTVLEYIKDEVIKESFTLKDPGNSSNDVADTLTMQERQNFSNDIKNMLARIDEKGENIKAYYPENAKFKDDEKKYENKGDGYYSAPPKNERFG